MSTPHARNIVRKLLSANRRMKTQDLYSQGLTEYPATPFPRPPPPKQYPAKRGGLKPAPPPAPNPGHPFRSKAYLKHKVLSELVASGEVQKVHEIVPLTPSQALSKKRVTRSKAAMDNGGVDAWQWQLAGAQAKAPQPLLEDEPIPDSHDWYNPNHLFPTIDTKAKRQKERGDTYGPGRWDHLNTRRQNARPEQLRMAKEWTESVQSARAEGARRAAMEPTNVA